MLRGRAASRWLWITPVPDDEIIRKKNEPLTVQASECTLNEHVFCLDNGEELTYILALIKLDKADTPFVHIVEGIESEQVKIGMRVKAVFADKTTNTIRDIDHFEPIED